MKAVLAAVLLFSSAALAQENSLKPSSVKLLKVKPVSSSAKDEVTGSLYPSKLVPSGFEVGGRLLKSYVNKGDMVKAGQLLGQLDPEIIDAQVAQAEAGLAAAEAGAEMAADVAGRNTKLLAEGSVSDVQSKGAVTTSKQAAAQVLIAKAALAQARAGRRRHDLRAAISGTIIDAPDQVGTMVGPGMPVFIIEQLDPLLFKTTVSEAVRAQLKVGAKVRVQSVGAPVFTDEATIKVVLPVADPQTRRVPVEIWVPNPGNKFVGHTLAKGTLPLGDARPAIAIPSTALGTQGGEHVMALGDEGKLKRVAVQVLERTPSEVVVQPAEPVQQVADYPTAQLEGVKVSAR